MRNVEVSVRDNDTPGVYVTEVAPGTSSEDRRTLVVEGSIFNGGAFTGRSDELLVQLAKAPQFGDIIRVRIVLDADSQAAISLSSLDDRFVRHVAGLSTSYTIDFSLGDWDDPVRVKVDARDDAKREDLQTAVIGFERDPGTADADGDYAFPNLRSGLGLTPVEVVDDDTAGVVTIESGTGTIVARCAQHGLHAARRRRRLHDPPDEAARGVRGLRALPDAGHGLGRDPHRRPRRRAVDQRRARDAAADRRPRRLARCSSAT